MQTLVKRLLFIQAIMMLPTVMVAAESTPEGSSPLDVVTLSLVCLAVVLMLGIGILGNALKHLVIVYRDKMRSQRANKHITEVVMLLFLMVSFTFSSVASETDAIVAEPSFFANLAPMEYYVLIAVIGFELLIITVLILMIRMMVQLIIAKPELAQSAEAIAAIEKVQKIPFWDRFNKAVVIEKEHDIVLDHEYDGIRELDNSLPPWWKYGFYLTILVAVVYVWYYHAGGDGPSSLEEYAAEVQAGEEAKAAYLANSANNVDENTVTLGDASIIAQGQTLFQNSCAACHAADGGGGVGPNLADAYWLHGGSLQDVFKSVKYGWPDKGMKSWKDDFSPKQIASISSYIISIQGSKPAAPKEKQGELFTNGSEGSSSSDSTKTVVLN